MVDRSGHVAVEEQPVLTGSMVTLRPRRADDVDDFAAACQDPDLQRWTSVPAPYRRADAVGYVQKVAPSAWVAGCSR